MSTPSQSPTDKSALTLGPFRLLEVLGQAGMGVVWSGVHIEQSIPVAIKFLTEEGARDPLYLACLRNEVRKVATLDHPVIIRVHDFGEVPEGLQAHGLISGSPYLVMELAEGGTLVRHCGQLDWGQIWRTLMKLLEGLAHAHARGVIHRDLKPGNVLLRHDSGGVVLVDFGLASAGDTDGGALLNAGTPNYMAPEQIQQLFHEIGPWTDMYAFGCLAWSLVCGRPPFCAGTIDDVLDAHLNDPVPALNPRTPVPNGFEAWVSRLLRKSPHHRFVRAADAAHELAKLAPLDALDTLLVEPVFSQELKSESASGPPKVDDGVLGLDDTQLMAPVSRSRDRKIRSPGPLPSVGRSLLWVERGELPPIPPSWREKHALRPIGHLLGTGLGMFGLRSFPVVGRSEEQNALWETLKRCRQQKRTHLVILEGADGTGKTHLAQWLARRSYEVGASIVLRAKFQASDEGDPLVSLIHSLLSTAGSSRVQAERQIRAALDIIGQAEDAEVEALLTVIGPFEGEEYSREVMEERNEVRFTVVRRLLHRFSVLRPVVVVLDDAHLSADGLRFARTLLSPRTVEHPVMVIMTVNTMGMDKAVRSQVEALKARTRVHCLSVGALPSSERSVLVRTLLGLAPSLAALVERRCGGNPQFAVQLVGDWILKGHLVSGEGGFEMRPGVRPEFPADMQAMWERRLAAALPFERDTRSLQVAAELGLDVDEVEWEEACKILGIVADTVLIEHMIDTHLLTQNTTKTGWRFTHALVAESLKRAAEFEGNRRAHHGAVAQMLAVAERDPVRRGRHLFASGECDAALPVLLAGGRHCYETGKMAIGIELVELRERGLVALGIPEHDIRWSEGWLLKERFLARKKQFHECLRLVERVIDKTSSTPGSRSVRAKAWFHKGSIHRLQGHPDEARVYLNRAMSTVGDDPMLMADAMEQLGALELIYGNPVLSARFFEGALEYAEKTENADKVFQVRQTMAAVYRRLGDIDTARDHLSASLAHYRSKGAKRFESRSLNDLAELDRFEGDLVKAEAGYRQALSLLESLGDQRFYVAALNLGMIFAETDRPVEARVQLEQCFLGLRATGLPGIEGVTLLSLAHVHAQLLSIEEWRTCFDGGRKLVMDTGFSDIDIARSCQMSGEVLLANGHLAEAEESLVFARDHWEILERDDEAAALTDLLAEFVKT